LNYYCINSTLADATYNDTYTGIENVNVTVSTCQYGEFIKAGFFALSMMFSSILL